MLLAAVAAWGAAAAPAGAGVATGGTGRFGPAIVWIEWGPEGTALATSPDPPYRTSLIHPGGREVRGQCRIGQPTGTPLTSYRSGSWTGDVLPNLYNRGGTGGANTLIDGIKVSGGTQASFELACSAAIDGDVPGHIAQFPTGGIVLADAEQSDTVEYIDAATLPGASYWLLDRDRTPGCTKDQRLHRTFDAAGSSIRMGEPLTGTCAGGPAGVVLLRNSANAQITLNGTTPLAAGVLVPIDHGDAPASYGDAAHAWAPELAGAQIPFGDSDMFGGTALATAVQPEYRLGATVDADGDAGFSSAGADHDDTSGAAAFGPDDDEDADPPSIVQMSPGGTLELPPVPCTGGGVLAAWIDFDGDGSFGTDERSADVTCAGGSAVPAWTVPADAVAQTHSYLRLRYAATAAEVADPTGLAFSGEVEDHPLELRYDPPQISLSSPGNGTRVSAGAVATVAFTCAAGAGIQSCTALVTGPDGGVTPVAPGDQLPTALVGRYGMTVKAVAGNTTSTLSTHYEVTPPPATGTPPAGPGPGGDAARPAPGATIPPAGSPIPRRPPSPRPPRGDSRWPRTPVGPGWRRATGPSCGSGWPTAAGGPSPACASASGSPPAWR